ncbi:ferredoxin [Streptococcus sp. DD12]|uniref:ferredoxin n=1 Tax=Streptococcus sp. DD12 TaxID=1777880 RepID=UPI000791E44D|nr:ferredoxin [Streptococcus sp. DD12]KXT76408.1 Ferredoxin [Streptococcus sp. DD12]
MKVQILPEKCIACGLCQTLSPLFDYDDEGIVIFAQNADQRLLDVEAKSSTLAAVKACPTKALIVKDA